MTVPLRCPWICVTCHFSAYPAFARSTVCTRPRAPSADPQTALAEQAQEMIAMIAARAPLALSRVRIAPKTRRPANVSQRRVASCLSNASRANTNGVALPRSRVSRVNVTRSRVVSARASQEPVSPRRFVALDDDSMDEDSSDSFDDDERHPSDVKTSYDQKDVSPSRPRKPLNAMGLKEKFEYVFVRVTLVCAGAFALLGVVASLMLSGLLFAMGMKEVAIHAVGAFFQNNAVGLVSAAVGALDRFLLGMVCLVFGLGTFELFLARSNREGEVRDRRLKKLAWLRVSSIDDLEQKVGEIIVAVMVVNLLEMSLHMKYSAPLDLVYAALAAFFSAGALAVLHWSSMKHAGGEKGGAAHH